MKIIFEFVGGPMDGKTVLGHVGQQDEADRYYVLTHRGRIGQRFRVASKYAIELLAQEDFNEGIRHHFQQHRYQVTDRIESDDEVLIRVEYVERETEATPSPPRQAQQPDWATMDEAIEQSLTRLVHGTARSMADSYSHYWPADDPSRAVAAQQCTALHVGHVLLSDNFSLLLQPPRSAEKASAGSELLALASSQDWFLACAVLSVNNVSDLQVLEQRVGQMERLWLEPGMVIQPCRDHFTRLADHCGYGYALALGIHRDSDENPDSAILDFWRTRGEQGARCEELTTTLSRLNGQWLEPILVRAFGQHCVYHLLSVWFKIPRHDTRVMT